eukprot:g21643.t1
MPFSCPSPPSYSQLCSSSQLLCSSKFGFQDTLRQADALLNYDTSRPEEVHTRRGIAQVVKADGTTARAYWYYQLYQRVSETVSMLRSPKYNSTLTLIGTAHISKDSADEVRDVIRNTRPDAIMVELCHSRLPKLMKNSEQRDWANQLAEGAGALAMAPMGGSERLVGLCLNTFYGFFKLIGFSPGLEFKTAIEESQRLGCTLVLGDKPQNETLKALVKGMREDSLLGWGGTAGTSGTMPPSPFSLDKKDGEKGGLFRALSAPKTFIESRMEKTKNRELVRNITTYFSETAPTLCKGLLHDRDEFMEKNLQNTAADGHERIVAVVGLAHMDGIEKRWLGLSVLPATLGRYRTASQGRRYLVLPITSNWQVIERWVDNLC